MKNRCLVCGSSNLKADRALSGRLICTSCGNLYGVRKSRRNQINDFNLSSINSKKMFYIFLIIFIIILVII